MNFTLLEQLVRIQGVSSDEGKIASFILKYISENKHTFKVEPEVFFGPFQDAVVLVFGKPRTAVYAHTDTIGYSVGYNNELIKVGGPKHIDGTALIGEDKNGVCHAELAIYEEENGSLSLEYLSERPIERGTLLSFYPTFIEDDDFIQSAYLDNRLGVWTALQLAQTLENGAIVFSTYEEHGGNSVGACAKFLFEKYNVQQALICDITWVTEGVEHGKGVAISMRDSMLPRKSYLNKIISIAEKTSLPFQLEVESAGGSDGSVLQKSDLPIDWCFIGAAEDNVHTPMERVHKADIQSMLEIYRVLLKEL